MNHQLNIVEHEMKVTRDQVVFFVVVIGYAVSMVYGV